MPVLRRMKLALEAARYPYPLDMSGLSADPDIRMEIATSRRPASRAAPAVAIGTERGPDWEGTSPKDRGVIIVSVETPRRRSREALPRPRVVQFSLTEAEFDEVSEAAAQVGLARGAFAAEVTLAAARGVQAWASSPLREALRELMAAAGLVRRIGTNLNQAVARLNATGQPGEDLVPAAEFCVRVIRRLDEAAEQVRRSIL
jgi:hypothetical protein